MKCIMSPFRDCARNIGSEEYYLSAFDDAVFYLYINDPCIVVGRHQNTFAEINAEYVQENGIAVVRRMSGGGAVYHDGGNLNYGFIAKNCGQGIEAIFREYTRPILNALKTLGVTAEFSGRNDLLIDGKKISGTAQYHYKDKILLHGTLLFSSDLAKVAESLRVDPRKFEDKAVKSVKSRVTTIAPHLAEPLSIEAFSERIFQEVILQNPDAELYSLTEEDCRAIGRLAESKYATREWVYGASPVFTYSNSLKYEGGLVEIGLVVEAGQIKEMRICGDFFGEKEIEELYAFLVGLPYKASAVREALSGIDIGSYLYAMTPELLCAGLFNSL